VSVSKRLVLVAYSHLVNFCRFQVLAFQALFGRSAVCPVDWSNVATEGGFVLQRIVELSDSAQEFDATKECWKLSQKFVDYLFALPTWFNLVSDECGCDPNINRFFETATEEKQAELFRLSEIINDCTKHLSELQERMIFLEIVER